MSYSNQFSNLLSAIQATNLAGTGVGTQPISAGVRIPIVTLPIQTRYGQIVRARGGEAPLEVIPMTTRILHRGQVREFVEEVPRSDCIERIIQAIRETPLSADQFMIIWITYRDGSVTHIIVTPVNRRNILTDFQHLQDVINDSDIDAPVEETSDRIAEIWRKFRLIEDCGWDVYNYHEPSSTRLERNQWILDNPEGFLAPPEPRRRRRREGAFARFYHTIENEFVVNLLKEYQIYTQEHIKDNKYNPEAPYSKCLIQALKGQVSESIIQALCSPKDGLQTDFFPKDKLPQFTKKYKIPLKLIYLETNNKRKTFYYNIQGLDEDEEDIPTICLIDGHYFRYDEHTGITKYYIKNYKDIPRCKGEYRVNAIKKNNVPQFCRILQNTLDSFDLVRYLIKHNHTRPLDVESLLCHPEFKATTDNKVLEELKIDDHTKLYESSKAKTTEHFLVADFEAYTQVKDNNTVVQMPFMLGLYGKVRTARDSVRTIDEVFTLQEIPVRKDKLDSMTLEEKGDRMIDECFNYLINIPIRTTYKTPIVIFFHNLTYDVQFLLRHKGFISAKPLVNNGRMVSMNAIYTNGKVQLHLLFKDSLRILANRAEVLPKMFDIPNIKKEVIFYELFRSELMERFDQLPLITVREIYADYIQKANDVERATNKAIEFEKALVEQDCILPWEFANLLHYTKFYCRQDCRVVYEAMIRFNDALKAIEPRFKDIWNFYSLPSVALEYLNLNDCFSDCYQMTGTLGIYFDQFIIGGRCMLANNQICHKEGKIQDFDAVSLYPSAMRFFPGFVKGTPKPFKDKIPEDVDYYYVRIKITKVGKNRPFPVISVVKKDGIRDWTNDLVDQVVALDKIGLEDAVEFQQIEYEVIDGYYFNEGFNTTINQVIEKMFKERKINKQQGRNAMQLTLKLLMNSGYGKTIQKTANTDIKIMTGYEEMKARLLRNANYIFRMDSIGEDKKDKHQKYIYKESKPIVDCWSLPHLGVQILSYSKRIMNRVMCLADDIGVELFYQDTDSIHMYEDDVDKLSKAFKDKYNLELIGSDMGQFHCDFESDKLKGKIYSQLFIGCGKKMYLDRLVGDNGTDYHIRMKGIPPYAIEHYSKQNELSYEEIYWKLYSGESLDFDLLSDNRVSFEKSKDFSHSNRTEFKRSVTIHDQE